MGGFFQRQPGKEAVFDHLCLARVEVGELGQGFVECEEVVGAEGRGIDGLLERYGKASPPRFSAFRARALLTRICRMARAATR